MTAALLDWSPSSAGIGSPGGANDEAAGEGVTEAAAADGWCMPMDRIPVALREESAVCCLHGVDDCRGLAMALLAV